VPHPDRFVFKEEGPMSANPEVESIVSLPVLEPEPEPEPAAAVQPAVRVSRPRPAWLVPASIAAIGVIVAGGLGFLLYTTTQQRDALHAQLVSTKTTLASTQTQLTAAQADAAQKKVTADYLTVYISDEGKVLTDYEAVVACGGYSECRTGAQQFLTDMQSFQSDRKVATVPSGLQDQDSSLGDALSAAIAGDQELISGMDNGDVSKITDGSDKVDAAMLNLAKAGAAMGTALK
jgi:hypothetical protein